MQKLENEIIKNCLQNKKKKKKKHRMIHDKEANNLLLV